MIEKLTCLFLSNIVFVVLGKGLTRSFFPFDDAKLRPFQSVTNKNAKKRRKTCILLIYVNDCVRTHIKKHIFLCAHTVFGVKRFLSQKTRI